MTTTDQEAHGAADATRPDLASLPSAADIVRYMRATGWAHGRQGSHGAMWTRGDVEFSVPHEDHNPAWLREVVARLASAEGRTPEETAAAVAEYRDARGPEMAAGVPAVTSPAPALAERPGTATGPAAGSDEAAHARQLAADAEAADAAYKVAATRAVLYEFLHQYGRSALPTFKVALDLASSLRNIIDDLGDEDAILAITGTGEEAGRD